MKYDFGLTVLIIGILLLLTQGCVSLEKQSPGDLKGKRLTTDRN